MRKYILYSALFAAIGISVSACNDYDPEIVEYETTEGTEGTAINPPELKSDWDLELLPNTGQHDSHVFVYKASNPQLSSSASFLRLNVLSSLN